MKRLIPLILLAACAQQKQQPFRFERKDMLASIAQDIILPAHRHFLEQAALLEQATTAFIARPQQGALDALRLQWKQTTLAWKDCELFELGPVADAFLHYPVYKRPTNADFIEEHIASRPAIDAAFVQSLGSTSRGLPALEYLLFDPEGDDTRLLQGFAQAPRAAQRRQYLLALAQDLHQQVRHLWLVWSPEGEDYASAFVRADASGSDAHGSISLLANQMVVLLESIAQYRLGRPLGFTTGGLPRPDLVEAPLSACSLPFIIQNIRSFARTFRGHAGGPGFDQYLVFLEGPQVADPLSRRLDAQIDAALAALQAIQGPLHQAVERDPNAVRKAFSEVHKLLVLVKVQMANVLGVTIAFSALDGD